MTAGSRAKARGDVVVVEQAGDSHLPSTPVCTGRHCIGYRRSRSAIFHPTPYSIESVPLAFRNFGIRLHEIIKTVYPQGSDTSPPFRSWMTNPGLDTLVTNVNPSEFLDLVRTAGRTLNPVHADPGSGRCLSFIGQISYSPSLKAIPPQRLL